MNRSILIVICDFLLVSLLVFSTPDISKVSGSATNHTVKLNTATNQPGGNQDLAQVMQLALQEERKSQEKLLGELQQARETAAQRQAQLNERNQQVQTIEQQLHTRTQEAQQLQQTQTNLQQQFAAAQMSIQTLSQQLQGVSADAAVSKEKFADLQAEMKKRAEEAAALQKQLEQLSKSNELARAEKQHLATQLQLAEVERRHATEQVVQMREEVKTERAEKAKLAEGVSALASKSGQLVQEIRENRALTPNTIFNEFLTNRVEAHFNASRTGVLGNESVKDKDTETVLVTDGKTTYALCHVDDTPLTLWAPGTDWNGLTATLSHDTTHVESQSLSFHFQDPRVVLLPLNSGQAEKLGAKVYRVSSDPYKFQDAVLVGTRDSYCGECKFEIDPNTPQYVKLDRSVLKGLFGQFNPSRGDLVFSRNNELLGVMANSSYCLMIRNFDTSATFQLGWDVRSQHTGNVLSQLYSQVAQLPFKLQ